MTHSKLFLIKPSNAHAISAILALSAICAQAGIWIKIVKLRRFFGNIGKFADIGLAISLKGDIPKLGRRLLFLV
jgi:hypothetical protein